MSAQHTPGPWQIGHLSLSVTAACASPIGGSHKVCDIRGWGYLTGKGHGALGLSDEEARAIQEANARLIAAAPDLLAAVRELAQHIVFDPDGDLDGAEFDAMGARALSAIAKAEGRS